MIFVDLGGLSTSKDHAVVAEDTGDPVHGCRDIGVVRGPQAEEPSEGFMIFAGNMDGGQVGTPVETSEHGCIQAVGLAAFSRFVWDE